MMFQEYFLSHHTCMASGLFGEYYDITMLMVTTTTVTKIEEKIKVDGFMYDAG
jgi:hypothetical protein